MNWREAREALGWTQEDVTDSWKKADIPDPIKRDLSVGKYARLDAANPSAPVPRISAVAKWELARLLGVELREVDPDAADEMDAIVLTVSTRDKRSSRCKNTRVDVDLTVEHALDATAVAA